MKGKFCLLPRLAIRGDHDAVPVVDPKYSPAVRDQLQLNLPACKTGALLQTLLLLLLLSRHHRSPSPRLLLNDRVRGPRVSLPPLRNRRAQSLPSRIVTRAE